MKSVIFSISIIILLASPMTRASAQQKPADTGVKKDKPLSEDKSGGAARPDKGAPLADTSPPAPEKKDLPAIQNKPVEASQKERADKGGSQPQAEKKDTPAEINKEDEQKEAPADPKEAERQKNETSRAESLENILKYGLQSERRDAVKKVLSIKNKSLRDKLAALLLDILKTDEEPEVLARAINTLGELKHGPAAEAIEKHLENTNEDVRIAAVYNLKKLEAESSKTAMAEQLKKQDLSQDSNFTEALIVTLGDFKSEDIYQTAEEAIKSTKTTKNIREQFIIYMGKLGSPNPKELLLNIYKDPDEDVSIRSYAVNSLSKLGLKETIPEIQAVLKEINSYNFKKKKKYNTLQIYSTAALAKLGDPQVVPMLISQLKSDNPGVRLKAITLLKELGDKSSIDILKYRMKNDPDPKVRRAAKGALKEMGVEAGDDSGADEPDDEQKDEAPDEPKKKDKK